MAHSKFDPRLVRNAQDGDGLEMSGSRDHGIGAVRDQYASLRSLTYLVTNAVPVLFSQFHAVFCQECFDDIGDGDTNMLENFCDLGISYLIITLGVKVHFVNCATSGEDKDFGRHYHGQCKKQKPRDKESRGFCLYGLIN